MGERFARRWQRAGLIDEDAVRRIVAWEAAHRRPVWLWAVAGLGWLWAVAGLGALAIGLGVLAVVGANWESIPAWLKLSVDLGVTALLAWAVFFFWRRDLVWPCEISALLLFGLVLSGVALIGQVYQLQSAAWHALVLWLVLCTPFLALVTRTRLIGIIWAMAVVTTWFAADDALADLFMQISILPPDSGSMWSTDTLPKLMTYLPACGLIAIASIRRLWAPTRGQGKLLLQLSFAGLTVATSLSSVLEQDIVAYRGALAAGLVATVVAGIALLAGGTFAQRRGSLTFLGVSFVAWAVGLFPLGDGKLTPDVARALLFIAYWSTLCWLAAQNGWRGLFAIAFTMVGLRLLIFYFEAIGGLTATGLGLIGGGVLCLALAAIGWRLTRGVPHRSLGAAS